MGEVYVAEEDVRLHRKVALKILPSAVADNMDGMRRFVKSLVIPLLSDAKVADDATIAHTNPEARTNVASLSLLVPMIPPNEADHCLDSYACQPTPLSCNSITREEPHPAEAFPAAIRQLLEHPEHRATNMHRRATRRCAERAGPQTPPDCPATIQKS
jgi:hypothetical protein